MRYNAREIDEPTAERVQRNGRTYLSFPLVPLREMVLNYPEYGTDEYLSAEKINASASAWDGTPLTFRHPPDRGDGQTVRTPDAYTDDVFGQFHDPEAVENGAKLRGRGLIDVEKANALGGTAAEVVRRLQNDETVAVSAGYRTNGDRVETGHHDGDDYNVTQGDLDPDHIAVFPPDEFNARCSPEDGCAAPRVNAVRVDDETMTVTDDPPDISTIRRVLNYLPGSDERDIDAHDHDDCGCDGECDDCSVTTNADESGDAASPPDKSETNSETNDPDETDTMSDEDDIELDERRRELFEQTNFSKQALANMTDDDLDHVAPGEGDDEAEAEEQTETETTDETGGDDAEPEKVVVNADELDEMLDERVDERVEQRLEAEKTNTQVEQDARIVANAIDDIDESAAKTMDPDVLSNLADEHRGAAENVTNYGAVPGPVERVNAEETEEDVSDVSAGSYSDWKARNSGGDA